MTDEVAEGPVFGRRGPGWTPEPERAPVPFQLAGYCVAGKCDDHPKGDGEHLFSFSARGRMPMGSALDMGSVITSEGGIQAMYLLKYLSRAVIDEDRNRMSETLDRTDVNFEGETLLEVVGYLNEAWGAGPLANRSERRRGLSRTGPSSTARSSARASA